MLGEKVSDKFTIKDSGTREDFPSGMRRDTAEGKARYDLIPSYMLTRWAHHMAKGAVKYGENNWQKANSPEELARFKQSAFRHFMKWMDGVEDSEDHASAILYN